jgi:hypothetical protein
VNGKLHPPIRCLLRCGIYAYIDRFDHDVRGSYWIRVPYSSSYDFNETHAQFSVDRDGRYCYAGPWEESPFDVTHYFVGVQKRLISLLDLEPQLEAKI